MSTGGVPLIHWLPVGAWMALIFVISAQPQLPGPSSILISVAGHFLEYFVLALLLMRALTGLGRKEGWRPRLWSGLWSVAIAAIYAASDELHQSFVSGRSADVFDWIWDLAGATVALIAWGWILPKIPRRQT